MENEEKKKMKYVPPTVETMKIEPGNLLVNSIGASSGGWSLDSSGNNGNTAGASSGGWTIDGSGTGSVGTGTSAGSWGTDNSGSGSTGASTGGWSKE